MSIPVLAISKDWKACEREKFAWQRHGVNIVQVDTMREAIDKLCHGIYRFVTVNADNIPYLSLLPVMREVTSLPIFVTTSTFTISEQVKALYGGADVYTPFQSTAEENVLSSLALLHRQSEQRERSDKPIACRGLLIDLNLRQAFLNDCLLDLTPIEFRILLNFAQNRGRALSKEGIYGNAWNEDNCLDVDGAVSFHIYNLRREIAKYSDESYIETIWGYGFRLIDNPK